MTCRLAVILSAAALLPLGVPQCPATGLCPSGGSLISTSVCEYSYAGTPLYSCSGVASASASCSGSVAATISSYTCGSGWTLSGASCSQTTNSPILYYTCPTGTSPVLSGTTCTLTTTATASCPWTGYSLVSGTTTCRDPLCSGVTTCGGETNCYSGTAQLAKKLSSGISSCYTSDGGECSWGQSCDVLLLFYVASRHARPTRFSVPSSLPLSSSCRSWRLVLL